ncbi:hypothetical protein OIU84_027563 [Salix udensis]|uniref:DUF2470 domain-containing protein n=1 Tax=Salix udensis TaxID=889485 RepID=A0AAD6KFS0_9ROSI|nr:hypothetical protein OIU84_027563 [Salix udensis]
MGDAIPVSEKDITAVRTAYLAKLPDSFWVDFGDFQFMRIEPKVMRYVSGVATALLGSGEFSKEEYQTAKVDLLAQFAKPVASHMNRDHAEDTRLIVQHSTSIPVDSAYMLDLDSLGFNVKAAYQGKTYKLRIPFPRRAEDRNMLSNFINEGLPYKSVEMYESGSLSRIKSSAVFAQPFNLICENSLHKLPFISMGGRYFRLCLKNSNLCLSIVAALASSF